ncbi:MAG TPA: hypothetical protein VNQ14_02225 [Woeseiaceae bacterium]|nr:hypothetical protein [Woeseiaceae bacterium]
MQTEMRVVHLLSEAEQELEAAVLHYESQQAGLGSAIRKSHAGLPLPLSLLLDRKIRGPANANSGGGQRRSFERL